MEHKELTEEIEQIMKNELTYARTKFNNMASAHEGFAIILEELDELQYEINRLYLLEKSLWTAVKSESEETEFTFIKEMQKNLLRLIKEAVQVGAMLKRFEEDILHRGEQHAGRA